MSKQVDFRHMVMPSMDKRWSAKQQTTLTVQKALADLKPAVTSTGEVSKVATEIKAAMKVAGAGIFRPELAHLAMPWGSQKWLGH